MRRLLAGLRGAALLLAAACPAAQAATPSLRCSVLPAKPLLGHPLRWRIRARDLPDIPMLQPARLGPDWLLQRQSGERSTDARGGSAQSLDLTLYPLRAGELRLPAWRAGGRLCAARRLRVADAAPGQPEQFIEARVDGRRAVVGQAVRVDLDVGSGGALAWQPVRASSDQGLLQPMRSVSTRDEAQGMRIAVQRQSWRFTPLRAGVATIRFGLLRATPFGRLRVYAVAPLRLRVGALPAYWPADAAVGRARLRALPPPRRLEVGQTGVLRARLAGVQQGRGALLRTLARSRPAGGALRLYPPRLSLDGASVHRLDPIWNIEWPFRVREAGRIVYPTLRVPYYDPLRGAPALAVAAWGVARAGDPRARHLLEACGLVAALLLALAGSRRLVLELRDRRCRARWRRIAERGDAGMLLRLWRDAAARGDPRARTLRAWVASQRCGGRVAATPELQALVAACERQRYARAARGDPID